MGKKLLGLWALLIFCSHDMYLKMDTYFIKPHQPSEIHLYNGTFEKSDNVITRDRMLDASLVGNGQRYGIQENQWTEKDSITILNFKSGGAGTWVAGISTAARNIEMEATAFNNYLKHDGVLDMLQWRRENGALDQDAVERYSKHVKALFQVGETRSDDWNTVLGYPIEFVPLHNPYQLHTGDELRVKLLFKDSPLANQLVYADYVASEYGHTHNNNVHSHEGNGSHSHENEGQTLEDNHDHTTARQLRTDEAGVLNLKLDSDGIWHLRTIHLVNSEEEGLTHESNWATLTFEVTHDHNQGGDHGHSHEEDGFPTYLFWVGSLLILGALFFWFNRKK